MRRSVEAVTVPLSALVGYTVPPHLWPLALVPLFTGVFIWLYLLGEFKAPEGPYEDIFEAFKRGGSAEYEAAKCRNEERRKWQRIQTHKRRFCKARRERAIWKHAWLLHRHYVPQRQRLIALVIRTDPTAALFANDEPRCPLDTESK